MFNSDFEGSVVGMEHLRSLSRNYKLLIPEILVELERKRDTKPPGEEGMTLSHLARDHHVSIFEQGEALKLAEKAMKERYSKSDLDKESVKALQASDQSISIFDRQKKNMNGGKLKEKNRELTDCSNMLAQLRHLKEKTLKKSSLCYRQNVKN